MSAAGLDRDLLEGEHAYALMAGGQTDRRAAGQQRPPRPAAAARQPPCHGRRADPRPRHGDRQEPAGFVDWHGYSRAQGGWFFGGWLRGEALQGSSACRAVARFEDGTDRGRGGDQRLSAPGHQPASASAAIVFLPSALTDPGLLQGLEITLDGERQLSPSMGIARLPEAELVPMVRMLLGAATRKPKTALLQGAGPAGL